MAPVLAPAAPAGAQPDLTISSITTSASREAVGEDFRYVVTARNSGNAPCNWLNLSVRFPGEVDIRGMFTTAPLLCGQDVAVWIVGEPTTQICRGGLFFLLNAGESVSVTYFARVLRTGSGITATATVDPGDRCIEQSEGNNSRTGPPSVFFRRPRLKMDLNKPFTALSGSRGSVRQTFPVTITNVGDGPAYDVKLAVSHGYIRLPSSPPIYRGPTLVAAYKGALVAEGATLPAQRPRDCSTSASNLSATNGVITYLCVVTVTLQPREMLQLRIHDLPCPSPSPWVVVLTSDVRFITDDMPPGEYMFNTRDACRL